MKINGSRMLERLDRLAQIGAAPAGGVTRLALTDDDTKARRLVIGWAQARGFVPHVDPVGNVFLRRVGTDANAPPVITGSHLDTQISGGNLDGIYGVLAGLEVVESLEDSNQRTRHPIDVVIWNNEEGVRFAPVTMGSSVYGGTLDLQQVLEHRDADGVSVRSALHDSGLLEELRPRRLGERFHASVELHIEQGPVLEQAGRRIGVVTAVQGVRQFEFVVSGEAAHAGTTPRAMRRDAFVTAVQLYQRLAEMADAGGPDLRFTVGRMQVYPGAPNTVPSRVSFTVDLRHPDAAELAARAAAIASIVDQEFQKSCAVRALIDSPPVTFDAKIVDLIHAQARDLQLDGMPMVSGATHDSARIAHLGPTAMIFVPSRDGISHNPREWTAPDQLVTGCELLGNTLEQLAG